MISLPAPDLERGSLPALVAHIAVENGLPGITAKGVRPKGAKGARRFVQVTTTPEGEQLLGQVTAHPFTRALGLLEEIANGESSQHAKEVSAKEVHRIKGEVAAKREEAAVLLGLSDPKQLPHLNDETRRTNIQRAVAVIKAQHFAQQAEAVEPTPEPAGVSGDRIPGQDTLFEARPVAVDGGK